MTIPPELWMDEATHTYHLGDIILPSVSEIMRPITKPELDQAPQWRLENARDRGIAVHRAIQEYILFGMVDPAWKEYVDQFILFLTENHLQVVWNEKALHNGEYAGTIDLLLRTPENALYLVDIKVTYAIKKTVSCQLCAYDRLLAYNGVSVSGHFVLHLKPDKHTFKRLVPDVATWEKVYAEFKNKSN